MLGEQFEEPKVIGLGLSLRTKERLVELWVKDGRNDKVKENISYGLRKILKLDPTNTTLYYKDHQKSIKVIFVILNTIGLINNEECRRIQVCESLIRDLLSQ